MRAGQRFGIIRFGSRADLYLPEGVRPLVAVGQTMIGGETVIAELDAMSGSPRPDWHAGPGRVSPIKPAAPAAPARPAALQGAVVQPHRAQPADPARPLRRPDLDALRL